MYDWIKNNSLLEYIAEEDRINFDRPDFRMEKVDMMTIPTSATVLAQLFLSPSVWLNDNIMHEIWGQNEEIRRLIMDEVAPHFLDVKLCVKEGEIETIYMRHVRPESKALLDSVQTGILPVMEDLYRHRDTSLWHHKGRRKLLYYTVKNEAISSSKLPDTQGLEKVLQKAYFDRNEDYRLLPLGWTFDDSLRESAALRFFAGFVPVLTLVVDSETNQVITLGLSREEMKYRVKLNSAKPGPPRRNKDFLYLDMGRGLVYVIHLKEQPPITSWDELKESTVYRLGIDQKFEEFDHEHGESIPEGRGFFFSQDSIQSMVKTVNRAIGD
ncbi:hypothetical protein [Paenibacillus sp. URB8-2]|uniref:hypothetical protein n=1 Tax=Paenibacillus sp. URB8-2 TaxID=2741301 RepID=UPI0015BEB8F4|nr:hypothetical protein [Paenibacillus sp. URB8-2]BCG59159.1 hypothetical protein PUR_25840 [Paenibacillus sp. URB8-2]